MSTASKITKEVANQVPDLPGDEELLVALVAEPTTQEFTDRCRSRACNAGGMPKELATFRIPAELAAELGVSVAFPRAGRMIIGLTDRRVVVWEKARFSNTIRREVGSVSLDVVADATVVCGDLMRDKKGVLTVLVGVEIVNIEVGVKNLPEACDFVQKLRATLDILAVMGVAASPDARAA